MREPQLSAADVHIVDHCQDACFHLECEELALAAFEIMHEETSVWMSYGEQKTGRLGFRDHSQQTTAGVQVGVYKAPKYDEYLIKIKFSPVLFGVRKYGVCVCLGVHGYVHTELREEH